jgi:hypothetical protein
VPRGPGAPSAERHDGAGEGGRARLGTGGSCWSGEIKEAELAGAGDERRNWNCAADEGLGLGRVICFAFDGSGVFAWKPPTPRQPAEAFRA